MVTSAKLAAFDSNYGRVELALTTKASKLLEGVGKMKKSQKLIFTINNQVSDALIIQKGADKNYFFLSISTSRKNADLLMKFFS